MTETWTDIKGFEGIYKVSNMGHVYSPSHIIETETGSRLVPEREIAQYVGRNGYLRVNLTKDKKRTSFPVHRLVAMAFVKNPFHHQIVNHKNENKHDNRAINLEWCSNTYNLQYGTTQKRRVQKIGSKVIAVYPDGKTVKFASIREAAKKTNLPLSEVYKTCRGVRDSYLGYKFKTV